MCFRDLQPAGSRQWSHAPCPPFWMHTGGVSRLTISEAWTSRYRRLAAAREPPHPISFPPDFVVREKGVTQLLTIAVRNRIALDADSTKRR